MPNAREFEDVLNWLHDVSRMLPIEIKSSAATHLRRIEVMRALGIYRLNLGSLYQKLMEKTKFEKLAGIVGDMKKERKHEIKRTYGVTDGRGMLFISHVGEVYPSGFLPVVAGNVRRSSLSEIYANSKVFVELKNPNNLKGKCGRCPFRFICGGSRARAYAVFGDYLAQEPCCIFMPERDLNRDDFEVLQNFLNF